MSDTTDMLIEISKKMTRIEDRDCDFRHNTKWLQLRARQDELIALLAKEKLETLEAKNRYIKNDKDEKLIQFYKDFLNKGEQTNEY